MQREWRRGVRSSCLLVMEAASNAIALYGSDPARPVRIEGVLIKTAVGTLIVSSLLAMATSPLMLGLAPFISVVVHRVVSGREAMAVMKEVDARARQDLTRALGRQPVYADFGAASSERSKSIVATGLAYDGERLYVVEESMAEPIPWANVRRFRWTIQTDQAVVVDVQVDVSISGGSLLYIHGDPGARANEAAKRRAAAMRRSGFFLYVADVARPVRHFVTSDRAVLERWFEILTQMKEGRLPVA